MRGEDGREGADALEAQDATGLDGGLVDRGDNEAGVMLAGVAEEVLWRGEVGGRG